MSGHCPEWVSSDQRLLLAVLWSAPRTCVVDLAEHPQLKQRLHGDAGGCRFTAEAVVVRRAQAEDH